MSNLIFLVSQPRSGSTMLQRILGAHRAVHTVSEPWVMLHPLYALRREGIDTEYDSSLARSALDTFFEALPDGEEDYFSELHRMYTSMYNRVLRQTEATLFLDKTPRYYFILPELRRTFPEACIVTLVRHPLSVLASIISTWVHSNWMSLQRYSHDLLTAPKRISEKMPPTGVADITVRYEDVVQNPKITVEALCETIGIDFDSAMIAYNRDDNSSTKEWRYGDQERVNERQRPTTESLSKWKQMANHPQCWRLFKDYAERLGRPYFNKFSYEYAAALRFLHDCKPSAMERSTTFPLSKLVETNPSDQSYVARLRQRVINRVWKEPTEYVAK